MQTATQESNTVQSAMQRAILTATEKSAQAPKPNAVHNIGNVNSLKSIVCRRDILGNALVFDVDSHTKTDAGEFIDYWDGKGTGMKTAPIQYYKVSKPMPPQESAKLSETFSKALKLQQVIVRQRLIKDHVMAREADGGVSNETIDDFKNRFRAAVDKMLESL